MQNSRLPAQHSALRCEVRRKVNMTRTLNSIQDTVTNTKHPFRQVDSRPAKAQKNRYERRKIREFLRLGDWIEESQATA
jgi:hypothetical protein